MIYIFGFYKFKKIYKLKSNKKFLQNLLIGNKTRGTIILSREGINGNIAGNLINLKKLSLVFKKKFRFKNFDSNHISMSLFQPFHKARVKIKKEVVPMNFKILNRLKKNNYIEPKNWNKLIKNRETLLIDVRKPFEYKVGSFKNSINPEVKNFREFPNYLKKLKKDKTIAMFCTGGIRCEKASNYLYKKGFKNIYMLKGGIINYFNKIEPKKNKWNGECFVFDNRVTLKKNATQGSYGICNACRMPISKKDKRSIKYKIGLSCPKCYDNLSDEQIKRFTIRHKQIINSKIKYKFRKNDLK